MNKIVSPRPRRHKHKDDMKQEIVAQVHKTIAISDTSSERTNLSFSDDNIESNKTYKLEDKNDKNDNYSTHTPSREISVDGESQINSKILSLIETEMRRDINKISHFTDSRPQSLSFYEDEKMPEELSGNLEMLSPEERKHYKKRKEYSQMDTEERNAYNVIQDLYNNRDGEEVIGSSSKKSKSRKKRHGDSEMGIGDSREMMIPKEKKKSKKKKRESTSPMNSSSGKRKHRKKDNEYEPKSEITVALEDLQDDVFENANEEQHPKVDKMNRSPRQSDKIYVQKKNKFEQTPRPNAHLNRQTAYDFEEDMSKSFFERYPIQLAIPVQKAWAKLSTLCHGLLAGLAIGQCIYIMTNKDHQDGYFFYTYSHYHGIYILLFYFLCVICIVSVLDRYDLAHHGSEGLADILICKRCSVVLLLYIACLVIHLSTANLDEKINLMSQGEFNETACEMTTPEKRKWNYLSGSRSVLALFSWVIIGFFAEENNFYIHLKRMEQFLPEQG